MSSGRFGAEIAQEALLERHNVFFLHAKGSHTPLEINIDMSMYNSSSAFDEKVLTVKRLERFKGELIQICYTSYEDYAEKLQDILESEDIDVAILAAAVSDYGADRQEGKMSGSNQSIELKPLPKLINKIKEWSPKTKLVGFKLLVNSTPEQLKEAAEKVIKNSGADMVVGNDLVEIRKGNHKLTFFKPDQEPEKITQMVTSSLAREVVYRAAALSDKKKILLAMTGSVASILVQKIVNKLDEIGDVRIVVTPNALKFGRIPEAYTDEDEWAWKGKSDKINHIALRDWADVLVIAPASANTLAKMANGLADNLVTSIFRAWDFDKKCVVAVAMNSKMFEHPLTKSHIDIIRNLGATVVDPISKKLLCGEVGVGALARIEDIVGEI
jgi:phosphopantothenoylcysteine decarboxylase